MSEYSAKTLREKAKAKARALANPGNYAKDQEVSSADWSPAPPLRTEIKTGARPIMKPSAKGTGESYAARDTKAAIGGDLKRGAFKSGGAVKDAGVKKKKALGKIDPSPKRGPAGHYKRGGKAEGGLASKLNELTGYKSPAEKQQEGMPDPKKNIAVDYRKMKSDTDKLDRMASPYKKGGRTKREDGGNIKVPSSIHKFDDSGKMIPPSRYDIYNTKTGKIVGKAKSRTGSSRAVDRRDNDYGAYAHRAVPIYDDVSDEKSSGGRTAKATGGGLFGALKGAAKKVSKKGGKTDINIVINAGKSEPRHPEAAMRRPAPDMMPPPPPMDAGAGAPAMPPMGPPGAGPMLPPGLPIGRKAGGRITKVAKSYKDMQAGSGSGEGRLQKTDIAKLHKDAPARKAGGRISKVAKSYKDMTAGAASGEGRLQKEDIAKAKKGRGR